MLGAERKAVDESERNRETGQCQTQGTFSAFKMSLNYAFCNVSFAVMCLVFVLKGRIYLFDV